MTPDELRKHYNLEDGPLRDQLSRHLPQKPEGTCAWCGGPLKKVRAWQIFCKRACRSEFHNAQRALKEMKDGDEGHVHHE